jgi:hypothetical protein
MMKLMMMMSRLKVGACWMLGIVCNGAFVCIAPHANAIVTGT